MELDNASEQSRSPTPEATHSDSAMAPRPTPDRNERAAAIERRLQQQRNTNSGPVANPSYTAFDEHHELRQKFRRMVDPGILRPNPRAVALEAIDILLKLSDNIIKNPNDDKYMRFKPTNAKIKQYLVDPQGTLEYAVEMGFRPEVENFQPYYVFNRKKLSELQVGQTVLKEILEQEQAKEEAAAIAKQREKAVAEAAVAKVKQAFLDDRKSKALNDRREKEVRSARAARGAIAPSSPPPSTSREMPGSGRALNGTASTPPPPAYTPPNRRRSQSSDDDMSD